MRRVTPPATLKPKEERSRESGDTLVEVLLAIIVLGIGAVALLFGFATAITASSAHRHIATLDASVRAASDEVVAQVQDAADNAFAACPTTYTPAWNLSGSFKVTSSSVLYWNGSTGSFSSSCPTTTSTPPTTITTNPQEWTVTIGSGGYSTTVTTVIYDPNPPTVVSGTTPSKLVFLQPTTANPGTGTINGAVSPQPLVAVEDSNGNIVNGDASSVTLSATGPGTLSSNCFGVENNGVFSFSGCNFNTIGTYTVTATDSNQGVTSATATYSVSTAPPAKLAFANSPVTGVASATTNMGPITLLEEDAFSNPDPGGALTVSLGASSATGVFSLTAGGAPVTSVTIPSGQDSVTFYYGDTAAGSPLLTASAANMQSGLQTETVNPGPESKLAITSGPAASITAGSTFNVGVAVEDQFGNTITTGNVGNNDTVQLALSSGTFSTGRSTLTATAANGVVAFNNLAINTQGSYTITATDTSHTAVTSATTSFTVTPAPPSKLAFTSTASGNHTVGTTATVGPLQVQVQDQFGNALTNTGSPVTLVLSSSSSGTTFFTPTSGGSAGTAVTIATGASSSSSFYYADTSAGSPTITALATVNAVGVTGTTNGFTMTPAAESMLAITTQPPTTVAAGGNFPVGVTVEDQYGNQITTGNIGSTDTIKLTLSSGSFASGTTSVAAVNGVTNFSGLSITTPGSYTVTASDTTHTAITAAPANPVTVTTGPPNKLVITTQPTGSIAAGGTVSVGVTIEDQYGNIITTGNTGSTDTIHVALSSGTFASGTTSVAAVNGVANFSGLQITNAGSLTITASDTTHGTVTSATTNTITVSPGPENKLAITTQPSPITAGGTVSVGVTVEDQYGNIITTGNTGSTDTLQVALNGASFAGGTTTHAAANGTYTFTGLQITSAGTLTITASDTTTGSVTSATSNSFAVSPAGENKLVITTQPTGSIAAGGTVSVGVTIEDQYGNIITTGNTGSTDTIHVALSSGTFASGTTSVAAVNGVANFSGLQITNAGSLTITASDTTHGTVTSATTNTITVSPGPENKLAITTQPSPITAGGTVSVGVTVEDQYGNIITTGNTGSTDTLQVALNGASFAGGTTTHAAANGTYTFTGLQITSAGTLTITASDTTTGSVTSATSNSFAVSPAGENKLVITTQPTGSIAAGGTVSVGVTIEDQYGNIITTGNTGSTDTIHVALSSGTFASGTTSVAAVNGVANFSGLQITNAGSLTITASDTTHGTVTSATTNTITVNPAAPNTLAFTSAPSGSSTVGTTASVGPFQVQVRDSYGNPVTNGGSAVTLLLSSNSLGATVFTPTSGGSTNSAVTIANGSSTSVPFYYADTHTGSPTITASATVNGTGVGGTTNGFAMTPAAEKKLAITSQPPASVSAGATFSVGVTVEDQYGNIITTGNTGSTDTIHVALSSGSFASGTTSVAATNGVANFSGLSVTTVGSYTITASDTTTGSVTSGVTNSVAVTPAGESKLVITTQPAGTITAGGTVSVGVTVEDQYGNIITTGNTGSTDTLQVALNGASFAGGTTTHAAANGTYTFTGLQITAAGSSYTITASDTTTGSVTSATSSSIAVNPAAENKLAITSQPPASVSAGATFSVGVTVEDQYGNIITTGNTGSTDTIHVALSSGSFASGTTSVAATNGVANFSGLSVTTVGSYTITASDTTTGSVTSGVTNSVAVTPAGESKLVITTQPAGTITAGGTVSVGVTVEDQYGNIITTGNTGSTDTLQVALNGASFAGGTTTHAAANGTYTFTGLQITAAGSLTITASDATHTAVATATTNAITVNPAAENKLAITAQPTSFTAGAGAALGATVEDQYGNPVTSGTGSADNVKVTLSSGNFVAGTTTVAANGGSAAFSGLQINTAGTYTITASDTTNGTVTAATTGSFTVSPAAENKLAITTQPASPLAAGASITVGVTVEDQYGNIITTGNTGSTDTIHVALSSGSFASGTTSVTAVNGVATFNPLTVTKAGSYTIVATDSTLGTVTQATTNSFTVTPASENKLVTTTQPAGSITAGGTVSVGVTVEDQYGNTITTGNAGSTDTVGLTLSSGNFASGTTSLAAVNGVANFSGLQITSTAGSPYTITAADTTHGTVTSATTNSISVSPAGENKLAITTQPPARMVNGSTFSVGATVEDQYGNPISTGTGSTDTIKVTLSSGNFASGTTSVTAVNGVATFNNLSITTNGSYTITASDTSHSVSAATTTSFVVEPPVTVAQSNSVNGTNNTESVSLTGGTPSAGSTLLVLVYALGNSGTPPTPTISGSAVSGTPAQIQTASPGGNYQGWAFSANASGTGTTVTASFGGNERDVEVDVLSLAGNNTGSTNAQSATNTGTGTTPTATLSTAPAKGDLEVGFVIADGNHGGVGTTPTGWSLLEGNHGTVTGNRPYGGASYYTNTNGGTSQAFSLTNSVGWATIAIDIGVA